MECPALCVGGLLLFGKLSCLVPYWWLLWVYAWGPGQQKQLFAMPLLTMYLSLTVCFQGGQAPG